MRELTRLADVCSMNGRLHIVNLGIDSQRSEAKNTLLCCFQTGDWLLLKNYHLANHDDEDLLRVITVRANVNNVCNVLLIIWMALFVFCFILFNNY